LPQISITIIEPLYAANIGYIARVMKNFNFTKLLIIKPHPPLEDSLPYAMHGYEIINNVTILDHFQQVREVADLIVGTTAKQSISPNNIVRKPMPLRLFLKKCVEYSGSVTLVFGREDRGLSNEELKICDIVIHIETNPEYSTLNIAHAATILLYELFQKNTKESKDDNHSRYPIQALNSNFKTIIDKVLAPKHKKELASIAFKNIIARSFISPREASVLLGLLRRAAKQFPDLNVKEDD
jgi:TrmH family RNA methyltransferase